MNYRTQRAIREWDAEVEAEAVRLIESGHAPFDAMPIAVRNVADRRKRKVAERIAGYSESENE